MRIGGKMWLAERTRQSSGFGYGKQLNRRAYEQARSTALSYGQSVFDANVSFVQESAALVLQQTATRIQNQAQAVVSNALTVDTSAYEGSSTSVDLLA